MGKILGRPETSFSCGLNPFSLPMADLHKNEHLGVTPMGCSITSPRRTRNVQYSDFAR